MVFATAIAYSCVKILTKSGYGSDGLGFIAAVPPARIRCDRPHLCPVLGRQPPPDSPHPWPPAITYDPCWCQRPWPQVFTIAASAIFTKAVLSLYSVVSNRVSDSGLTPSWQPAPVPERLVAQTYAAGPPSSHFRSLLARWILASIAAHALNYRRSRAAFYLWDVLQSG